MEEAGSGAVRGWLAEASGLATSALTYVEARSALARRRRARELSPADHRTIVRTLDLDWQRYVVIEARDVVLEEAVRLADVHALRGYDAIHLASAVLLRRRLEDRVALASWDDDLDAAAGDEGFEVLRRRR